MPNKKQNEKKSIYSQMNHAFVNSSYEQPEFSEEELNDKATFEKYLQGRVCYDRYSMLSRLATDVMAGRIKSEKFNNPEEDNLEEVCEHIWKVTEMDRFYLNQRNDEYAKYRSDVGTYKNFVKETEDRYETFKSDPEKFRTTGDLASNYALGKGERRDIFSKQNKNIAQVKSLLESAIEVQDNETIIERQNTINGYIAETLNKIFGQTSEEKETQKWNEAYNKAIKENNLDEKPLDIVPSKKQYRFFDNNGELEKDKAIEKISSGKLVSFMDETGAMSNIKFDIDNGFVEQTIEHQGSYKNQYKDMLKTLDKGTSAFTRSSKEYANMRGILDKLSKGIGNEDKLLEDLGKNYQAYCNNHSQKISNGKNSEKANLRKECADKMNEKLQQILTNKNADKARFELDNGFASDKYQKDFEDIAKSLPNVPSSAIKAAKKSGLTALDSIIESCNKLNQGRISKEEIIKLRDSINTYTEQRKAAINDSAIRNNLAKFRPVDEYVNSALNVTKDLLNDYKLDLFEEKDSSVKERDSIHHGHQLEINELKNEGMNSSKENLEKEQGAKEVDLELEAPKK